MGTVCGCDVDDKSKPNKILKVKHRNTDSYLIENNRVTQHNSIIKHRSKSTKKNKPSNAVSLDLITAFMRPYIDEKMQPNQFRFCLN